MHRRAKDKRFRPRPFRSRPILRVPWPPGAPHEQEWELLLSAPVMYKPCEAPRYCATDIARTSGHKGSLSGEIHYAPPIRYFPSRDLTSCSTAVSYLATPRIVSTHVKPITIRQLHYFFVLPVSRPFTDCGQKPTWSHHNGDKPKWHGVKQRLPTSEKFCCGSCSIGPIKPSPVKESHHGYGGVVRTWR